MTPTLLETLAAGVRDALARDGVALGSDEEGVTVTPVLNPGGFVNRSFHVRSGARHAHVKLGSTGETLPGLRRWRTLADRLGRDYRAPAMLAWIELEGTPWAGPMFEWFDGVPPASLDGRHAEAVVDVVARLHRDTALAAELRALGVPVRSCADAYLGSFHERFTKDLDHVSQAPPPFIDGALLSWMRDEAEALAHAVRAGGAFDDAADAPTHGDLWTENLLVAADGDWRLLDWDDLGPGDPAQDWAMLLGPTRSTPAAVPGDRLIAVELGRSARERLSTHARAALLDLVIDPLADWVQAGDEPEHGATVRQETERTHRSALRAYRERYATRP